jgi:hypothetical protein
MCAVTATQPFQGLRLLKTERVFPRVAKAQPWAEFSQRFQRYIQTAVPLFGLSNLKLELQTSVVNWPMSNTSYKKAAGNLCCPLLHVGRILRFTQPPRFDIQPSPYCEWTQHL